MPHTERQSGAERPGAAEATQTFDQFAVQGDALLGQMVGNYHVLAKAGEGASGRVYRARDVRLDRIVALKLLHAGASQARFEQEARALARLGVHPGVVDVYTWGEHGGQCYLALEYVPESVASLLARRPKGLDVTTALRVGAECAEALAQAHQAGVVHGDIKPSNILLSGEELSAKLCDFGLSSVGGQALGAGGSPAYAAPECAAGGAATPASDVYALAATIYAMLTGFPPVVATGASAALAASAAGKIRPLAQARPGLPGAVVDVVTRGLATDPAGRYADAAAFAAALRKLSAPKGDTQAPGRTGRLLYRAVALAGIVLVAAAVVLSLESFVPGGGGATVVLADARLDLNEGRYEEARAGFEQYLSGQPESAEARYGLAYSFLLEGDQARAEAEFARLGEAAMQKEGHAAVAYMAAGEKARPTIEQAAAETPGGYAAVLLSMLDMMAGKFDTAQQRLADVKEEELRFDWQRRQYLQTLGQLKFKAGDFAGAEAVFARLEQSNAGGPANGALAADLRALAHARAEASAAEDFSAQIARLKDALAKAPAAEAQDLWTSRPLRIWIAPVAAEQGLVMNESGLAEVLPWRLSRGLLGEKRVPITPVEREAEGAILAEQELSSALSNSDEALRLGRVMGARLLLVTKVSRVFNEELLHVSLVDTETTRWTPVGEYAVSRTMELGTWQAKIQDDLVAAVSAAYPVRGRISQENGQLKLNAGSAVGVMPGMPLIVKASPDTAPLAGVEAVVTRVDSEGASTVELRGVAAGAVPAEGWLAEQAPAPKGTANAA